LEGLDDGPNEVHHPHITIKPIGGPFGFGNSPFGGPFGGPFGFPFSHPGPIVHQTSFADLFKNIAKPGPHPAFDAKNKKEEKNGEIKITDITKKDIEPHKEGENSGEAAKTAAAA
jgi:hypothetical protein